jgi:ABC-type nickel/cobalt efflux system permease component RcnA
MRILGKSMCSYLLTHLSISDCAILRRTFVTLLDFIFVTSSFSIKLICTESVRQLIRKRYLPARASLMRWIQSLEATWGKEKTGSHKLSSNLHTHTHTHAHAHAHAHAHTHTHTHTHARTHARAHTHTHTHTKCNEKF